MRAFYLDGTNSLLEYLEVCFRISFMEMSLTIREIGGLPWCQDDVEHLLEPPEESQHGVLIVQRSVPQFGSIGQLAITYAGFKALFSSLAAFPPLLELVRAFGTKVNYDPNPIPPYQEHRDCSENVYGQYHDLQETIIRTDI